MRRSEEEEDGGHEVREDARREARCAKELRLVTKCISASMRRLGRLVDGWWMVG